MTNTDADVALFLVISRHFCLWEQRKHMKTFFSIAICRRNSFHNPLEFQSE